MPLTEDALLMSADDHLIEPAHLWVDRVPAKYRDSCPRIVESRRPRGLAVTKTSSPSPPMGSCRPLDGFRDWLSAAPGTARYDEIRPGCYDPVARLKDMDIDGVRASCASRTTPGSPVTASS